MTLRTLTLALLATLSLASTTLAGTAHADEGEPEAASAAPSACDDGEEVDADLCYAVCASGYTGVGAVCHDDRTGAEYERGAGTPPVRGAGLIDEEGRRDPSNGATPEIGGGESGRECLWAACR